MKKVKSKNVSDNGKKSIGEIINSINEVKLSESNEEAFIFLYADKSGRFHVNAKGHFLSLINISDELAKHKSNTEVNKTSKDTFLYTIVGIAAVFCDQDKEIKEFFFKLMNEEA